MRLIDADELKKALAEMWYENNIKITGLSVAELIDEAPTIEPCKSAEQNVADVPSGDLISREEAIDSINKTNSTLDEIPICKDIRSAFANAIKALPSADRKTDESCQDCPLYDTDNHNCPRFNKVIPQTRAELLADRPKGEWIEVTNSRGGHECSNCHAYAPSYMSGDEYLSDFCPNCGDDMRGEKDD